MSWFQKLKSGLSKTSVSLTQKIGEVFTHRKLDDETLDELEEIFIMADFGLKTASSLKEHLRSTAFHKELAFDDIKKLLADHIESLLAPYAQELALQEGLNVILIAGVNGSGKTTSIAKLAKHFQDGGKKVMLAAADTFRAAATEQLCLWGERLHIPVIHKDQGADPSAVAFDAFKKARDEKADVLIIDTAGRLHNHTHLMEELKKIVRTLKKIDADAPHESILVLDATTGQNALRQTEIFKEMIGLTGLIVTKLDGSAKGGMVLSITEAHKLPIYALGVGESFDDLKSFQAKDFANNLMDI